LTQVFYIRFEIIRRDFWVTVADATVPLRIDVRLYQAAGSPRSAFQVVLDASLEARSDDVAAQMLLRLTARPQNTAIQRTY
jgi:hypothetical protein